MFIIISYLSLRFNTRYDRHVLVAAMVKYKKKCIVEYLWAQYWMYTCAISKTKIRGIGEEKFGDVVWWGPEIGRKGDNY